MSKCKCTNTFDPTYRWYGVDLDRTLAEYNGECNILFIGKPIPKMVERIKKWLEEGEIVKIVTARVGERTLKMADANRGEVITAIQEWTKKHIGRALPVTAEKDCGLIELWDDVAVQVEPNTGERVCR